jgi:hypothetical protein
MRRPICILLFLAACGDDDDAVETLDAGPPDATVPSGDDLDMRAEDFECIQNGTKVRKFFVWNKLGHLDEALAVAGSAEGGEYPVGTILQLIPQEAMVKRKAGWDPTTNDWEFFALETSATGTTITSRGAATTVNFLGANCFDCHAKAEARWDLVCEDSHGCDPLGVTPETIALFQDRDPRCD